MKLSLGKKIFIIVLVLAVLMVTVSIYLSYNVHSRTMDEHYEKLAINVTETAAVTVDIDLVEKYVDKITQLYLQEPMKELENDSAIEEYYAEYEKLLEDDYSTLFTQLEKVKLANDVLSLYIIHVDKDTKSCVYIIDADKTETGCPAGTWDIIYEQNYDVLENPEKGFGSYITDTEEYGWLCSAGSPIMNKDGEVIAFAMVDISMNSVMKERQMFLNRLLIILIITSLVTLIIIWHFLRKNIVNPINALSDAAKQFVANINNDSSDNENDQKFFSNLKIKNKDEIGNLYYSVQIMEQEIHEYIDNLSQVTAEKERIGTELNIATQIQADMLPSIFPAFPDRDEFDIYATMAPAKEVGGDFYDFFMIDEKHLAIVVADVSGKGVPAALFMVIGKTLIKDHTQVNSDLGQVFTKVNNMLCESNSEGLFITAFEGVLDLETGDFVFVNAGHEQPFIYRNGGKYEAQYIEPGFVLAGLEDMQYNVGQIKLEVGDKFFQYTDGVTEATNASEELYGEERLENVLNKNIDKNPEELLKAVKEDIDTFVGAAPQFDDITMLSFEFKKKM